MTCLGRSFAGCFVTNILGELLKLEYCTYHRFHILPNLKVGDVISNVSEKLDFFNMLLTAFCFIFVATSCCHSHNAEKICLQ